MQKQYEQNNQHSFESKGICSCLTARLHEWTCPPFDDATSFSFSIFVRLWSQCAAQNRFTFFQASLGLSFSKKPGSKGHILRKARTARHLWVRSIPSVCMASAKAYQSCTEQTPSLDHRLLGTAFGSFVTEFSTF